MHRRDFLKWSAWGAVGGSYFGRIGAPSLNTAAQPTPPAFSVIPVVGDGKWIWTKPPEDATGFLEPRPYRLSIGVEIEGSSGGSTQIMATTPVPVEHPEQKIDEVRVDASGCEAELRQLAPGAGQILLQADSVERGQTISAIAHYRLTISKQYHAYAPEQFPAKQEVPPDVRKGYLQDSPGIQTSAKQVRDLAAQLGKGLSHPWDLARAFAAWIPPNIRPQIGSYTSVTAALDNRRGDCEEMSAVFVALCRSVGIPARLVWVPNHNWSEFYLVDKDKKGHWIPAHTACYSWFGYTGAHELVLQKGDRVRVPEQRKQFRLLGDWMQWGGRKPTARYIAELTPEPPTTDADAGPGARKKDASGEWKIVGTHDYDHYMRR